MAYGQKLDERLRYSIILLSVSNLAKGIVFNYLFMYSNAWVLNLKFRVTQNARNKKPNKKQVTIDRAYRTLRTEVENMEASNRKVSSLV